jgi:hypothetical protein
MTFREVDGQDTLIFKPGQDGRMQMILPYPFFIGLKAGPAENHRVLLTILGVSLAIMVLTLVFWPVAAVVRRYYGQRLELTRAELLLRIAVRVVFALDIIFIVAIFGLALYGLGNLWIFSDRGNTWFHLVQAVGIVGALGTLLVLYQAVRAWRDRRNSVWAKLRAATLVLACFGFIWFAFAGNLFHISSNY